MWCSQVTLREILNEPQTRLSALLGASMKEIVLFGSYARNDADGESGIDVMILTDRSRNDIAALNWQLGKIISEILLNHGVLISPIIENRLFFMENVQTLPFFSSIKDKGVRISA